MPVSSPSVKSSRSPQGKGASKSAQKGQQTKAAIVEAALGLATQIGLEGLSIGALAEVMHMSKSGVFAHFGSREELQISVVREYHVRFEEEVFFPALHQPRGLPRLHAMFDNWMNRTSVEIDSGCIYISGAVEFDDRPGPVRDALADSVRTWLEAMHRAVVQATEAGHFHQHTDAHQVVFEVHGLILALHYEARFLKTPGSIARAKTAFANMMARYGSSAALASPDAPVPQKASPTLPNPSSSKPT
ncbi:TetR/AcrR family transcriptional regulator [Polaromonas sp.]|uniref:TetR/AcrR family transcriptional regulator n=1 Tax=Polaromonas sp. TaxID=1869339 RepID=UPI0013B75A42|nr:TetR/AcrR family transcriptional regulator [Polaromonas sp.]NDP63270.1 TetR/AcrR family transcriptional regulator [Polaromonas sp.]